MRIRVLGFGSTVALSLPWLTGVALAAPGSMVVALTWPRYTAGTQTLTLTAIREQRVHDPAEKSPGRERVTTPATFTSGSLIREPAAASRGGLVRPSRRVDDLHVGEARSPLVR